MHWHRPLDHIVYFKYSFVGIRSVPAVRPREDVGVRARLVQPARLQLIIKPLRHFELRIK